MTRSPKALAACALLAASMLGAAVAEAKPKGNSNAGGLPGLAADVAALQAQVEALAGGLPPQVVAVDCDVDGPDALQAAIDTALPAGADITVSGVCGETAIVGKQNISLSGGFIGDANGMSGLRIEASSNVSLGDLTVYDSGELPPLIVSSGSSVFLDSDVSVAGFSFVESGSTIRQRDGSASFAGALNVFTGAQVQISEGTLGGFSLSRSASLLLTPQTGQSVVVEGSMGSFSGSNFLGQASSPDPDVVPPGSLVLSDPTGFFFIQRNAAALLAGEGLELEVGGLIARQNSVLDVIGVSIDDLNIGNPQLNTGGGARVIYSEAFLEEPPPLPSLIFTCDESAWTDVFAECAP